MRARTAARSVSCFFKVPEAVKSSSYKKAAIKVFLVPAGDSAFICNSSAYEDEVKKSLSAAAVSVSNSKYKYGDCSGFVMRP